MTAHLRIPSLDPTPNLPATLSYPILTGLLRNKLGFRGIIVTDAMDMGGVTTLFAPEEAAIRAVKAGADILLLPPKPKEVIQALVQAVRRGLISESRIDVSVKRILEAKARLSLHRIRFADVETLGEKIGPGEYLKQAERAFDSSMTLVQNKGEVLPLNGLNQNIAVFSLSSDPGGYFAGKVFVQEVKKRSHSAFTFFAEASTGKTYIQEGLEKASESDVIVLGLFSRLRGGKGSVDLNTEQIQLIKDLSLGDQSVVVISFGSPYFLRHFPEIDAYLCAYRYSEEAQKSAAKALFGEIDINGKLPVSIPGYFPRGHGLKVEKTGEESNSKRGERILKHKK
jgi:beta-N-acetylhexosaminidase